MIIIMGYVHVDSSDVKEFLADIEVIGPGTRAEKGCLFYAVALDDEPTGRMVVFERWQDHGIPDCPSSRATNGILSVISPTGDPPLQMVFTVADRD